MMKCQIRLQIYRVKNIGNVFEFSGELFCLAPPYGGLLFRRNANVFSVNAIVDVRLRRRRRHEMILRRKGVSHYLDRRCDVLRSFVPQEISSSTISGTV